MHSALPCAPLRFWGTYRAREVLDLFTTCPSVHTVVIHHLSLDIYYHAVVLRTVLEVQYTPA